MHPDPQVVALILEHLADPVNLKRFVLDRILIDKNDDKRVEILVARGLQCFRKFPHATNARQIKAAHKIFIAEMRELCKAVPTTEELRKAKASFLHLVQCFVYITLLLRLPILHRTAWPRLLGEHAAYIPLWSSGIEDIDPQYACSTAHHSTTTSPIPSSHAVQSTSEAPLGSPVSPCAVSSGAPARPPAVPPRLRGTSFALASSAHVMAPVNGDNPATPTPPAASGHRIYREMNILGAGDEQENIRVPSAGPSSRASDAYAEDTEISRFGSAAGHGSTLKRKATPPSLYLEGMNQDERMAKRQKTAGSLTSHVETPAHSTDSACPYGQVLQQLKKSVRTLVLVVDDLCIAHSNRCQPATPSRCENCAAQDQVPSAV
ncbi:unnamed protein product [Peniophora sp. CBMAI 1063]|nr:unnamed protein product [Peniophora sp. CBMAI 1063]